MSFQAELNIALAAVREAADLCRNVQREMDPGALSKKDRSPVTVADFGSQALICSRLRRAYPDDPIIAEETADTLRAPESQSAAEQVVRQVRVLRPESRAEDIFEWIDYGSHKDHAPRYWTLDPIDGTKGFLRGDQYAVALALIVDGVVTVAAVACPNLKLAAWPGQQGIVAGAIKGQGTRLFRIQDMEPLSSAKVSTVAEPSEACFSESVESGHTSHSQSALVSKLLGITKPANRLDSQAKYVVVASGEADIYLRLPTSRRYVENIWDHAAGMLLVAEAGGRVTDARGGELDFSHGYQLLKNKGILVTNGHLHSLMLRAVADTSVDE